jgi:hypothetical protein
MIVRLRVIIVIKEDHVNVMVECIRLERECADICAYLQQAIGKGSRLFQSWRLKFVPRFVEMNVKKHDHEHCQKCAEACLRFLEVCRKLAA